jgi:hypothetical protein
MYVSRHIPTEIKKSPRKSLFFGDFYCTRDSFSPFCEKVGYTYQYVQQLDGGNLSRDSNTYLGEFLRVSSFLIKLECSLVTDDSSLIVLTKASCNISHRIEESFASDKIC